MTYVAIVALLALPQAAQADPPPVQTTQPIEQKDINFLELNPDDLVELDEVATTLAARPIPVGAIMSLAWSPDGKTLAIGTGHGRLMTWQPETGAWSDTHAHDEWVFAIAYSPDGTKFVTGGGDNQVVVWDAQTTSKKVRMSYHLDDIHAVGFTADGARVISAGDDRTIRMFDTKTGEALGILGRHDEQITTLDIHGNVLATGSRDDTVRTWDLESGEPLLTYHDHFNDVLSVVFDPDGTFLASSGYDTIVTVREAKSGERLHRKAPHKDRIFTMDYSPNGRWLLVGGEDNRITLHDAGTFEAIWSVRTKHDVSRLAFHPSGNVFAAASSDGTVELRSSTTGSVTQSLFEQPVPAVATEE